MTRSCVGVGVTKGGRVVGKSSDEVGDGVVTGLAVGVTWGMAVGVNSSAAEGVGVSVGVGAAGGSS